MPGVNRAFDSVFGMITEVSPRYSPEVPSLPTEWSQAQVSPMIPAEVSPMIPAKLSLPAEEVQLSCQ